MTTEVEAIYHNGALELQTALPLKEGERVRVLVLTGDLDVEERVKALHRAADAWLSGQAPAGPPAYSADEWSRLDEEWDRLLAEILAKTNGRTEAEVAADVEEAVRAARRQPRAQ
jgi:predicted DNA-binding antitoxin AbrB/MazE fold protein